MKHLHLVAIAILGLSVSACGTIDVASRNAPLEVIPDTIDSAPQVQLASMSQSQPARATPAAQPMMGAPSVRVQSMNIVVPETLRVSEANLYYPFGDIVWREDPRGNRYEQVKAILEAGLGRGIAGVQGAVPVIMDIELTRFHSLSEKARYTIGGMHSIKFKMTLRHAETGAVVAPTREIDASFKAYGGSAAVTAEYKGITQKKRITERLASLIQGELMAPGSTQVAERKPAEAARRDRG